MKRDTVISVAAVLVGGGSLLVVARALWKQQKRARAEEENKRSRELLVPLFEKACLFATQQYALEFLDVTSLGRVTCCNKELHGITPNCHAWKLMHQALTFSAPPQPGTITIAKAVKTLLLKRPHDASRPCFWKSWITDLKIVVGQQVKINRTFGADGPMSEENQHYDRKFVIVKSYDRNPGRAIAVERFFLFRNALRDAKAHYRETFTYPLPDASWRTYPLPFGLTIRYPFLLDQHPGEDDMLDRLERHWFLAIDTLFSFVLRRHTFKERHLRFSAFRKLALTKIKMMTKSVDDALKLVSHHGQVTISDPNTQPIQNTRIEKSKLSAVAVTDNDDDDPSYSPGDFLEAIINQTLRGSVFEYEGRNLTPIWYRYVSYDQTASNVSHVSHVALDRQGHSMDISTYPKDLGQEGKDQSTLGYSTGFVCDRCGRHGDHGTERWFCLDCRADVCFDCISRDGTNFQSHKGKQKQWQWSADNRHWSGTDWMVAKTGEHAGRLPGVQNRDIIEFLQRVCPIPKETVDTKEIKKETRATSAVNIIARMGARQPTIDTLLPSELAYWSKTTIQWLLHAGQAVQDADGQVTIHGHNAETFFANNPGILRSILHDRRARIDAMGPEQLAPVRQSIVQNMVQSGCAIEDSNGQVLIGGRPAEESLTDENIRWRLLPLRR